MRPLKLVHAEPGAAASKIEVSVEVTLSGALLEARFDVRGQVPHVNRTLPSHDSQWGLWEWDVVELFLSTGGPAYYEFQVSPLGQGFELEIFEPRVRFNREFRSGFTRTAAAAGADAWTARLAIPLEALSWSKRPQDLVGNAFAILGPPGAQVTSV